MNPIIEILADITYARACFYRRHSIVPYQLMRQFLANEAQMIALLTQLRSPPPAAPPAPAPLAHNFDIPLNLVQLLFGRDATVGLGQGQGNPQFWESVVVGLTPVQFAAGTRVYDNPPDVAEQDQCCICQEGITTEAAIHTLCPGPALGDGVTSTNHHALHRRCAQSWFAISTKCPVCRADLRTLTPTTTNVGASSGGVHPNV